MNRQLPEWLWKIVAFVVSREPIANYLIKRAQRTPYFDLPDYMERDWLFNPYDQETREKKYDSLPSIRIHHILREDIAPHPHDHPWDARTIILRGWYKERRLSWFTTKKMCFNNLIRAKGDTAPINFGEYHMIDEVSEGGVYTLFITYKYRGMWGFLVNGVKMPWREYEEKYQR